ncbi:hypothetical protein YC2023_022736 [Brassica napus]
MAKWSYFVGGMDRMRAHRIEEYYNNVSSIIHLSLNFKRKGHLIPLISSNNSTSAGKEGAFFTTWLHPNKCKFASLLRLVGFCRAFVFVALIGFFLVLELTWA